MSVHKVSSSLLITKFIAASDGTRVASSVDEEGQDNASGVMLGEWDDVSCDSLGAEETDTEGSLDNSLGADDMDGLFVPLGCKDMDGLCDPLGANDIDGLCDDDPLGTEDAKGLGAVVVFVSFSHKSSSLKAFKNLRALLFKVNFTGA